MISCLHCRPGNVTSLLQNGHAHDCFSPTCLAAQQAAPHASLTSAWPFSSCSIPMQTHLHQNARKSAVSAHKQQLPIAPHAVSRMVFLLTSCSPCSPTSRLPFTRQQPMHLPQQLLTNSTCVLHLHVKDQQEFSWPCCRRGLQNQLPRLWLGKKALS